MSFLENFSELKQRFIVEDNHSASDYLGLITEIVAEKTVSKTLKQEALNEIYEKLHLEILENKENPVAPIKFGTSGWRGKLGKDIYARSAAMVTKAIVMMYESLDQQPELAEPLGVTDLAEAQERGCVLGFDNRFGGQTLARQVAQVLSDSGFLVYYAGESTTGVLSAAVLIKKAAFSINLTPSHNPLDYGGFKFNAADAGPAAEELTSQITKNAQRLTAEGFDYQVQQDCTREEISQIKNVELFDSLDDWKELVRQNVLIHGLKLQETVDQFFNTSDMVVAIDCVHGASRLHIREIFNNMGSSNLILLRENEDVTFGGVAPEPSTANMQDVTQTLRARPEKLKLGAIIDPDGDRIRFTDGFTEISMNQFGAMAYHFLHEIKGKQGMVAKTVATSNLANSLAHSFGEKLFEPSVGFKNFKPVIGEALVCFEESDGISIIGHTPEKDAYIGLLVALDMVLCLDKNLGTYLAEIEKEFGSYFPDRDGVEVTVKGEELQSKLDGLNVYQQGKTINVGGAPKKIKELITIDGYKIVFEDGSWLMIRPSGTEPKVRFYVESRTDAGTLDLVVSAKNLLKEIGL